MIGPRVHFWDTEISGSSSEEDTGINQIGSLIVVHKRNSVKFPVPAIIEPMLDLTNSISSLVVVVPKKPKARSLLKETKLAGSVVANIQVELERYTIKPDVLGISTKKPFYSERILQRHQMERLSEIIANLAREKQTDDWCHLSQHKAKLPIEIIYNIQKNKFYCIPWNESLSVSGFCMALLLERQTDTWTASRVWYITRNSMKNIDKILVSPLFPTLIDQFQKHAMYDYTLWPISSLTSQLSSISLKNKALIAIHIAEVIGALHRSGHAHRNITSNTISIASDGSCCFSGLDSIVSRKKLSSLIHNAEEDYMSLEWLQAGKERMFSIDEQKQEDMFALGCVFYTLLTQSALPWEEEEVVPLTSFSARIFDSEKKVDLEYTTKIKELLREDRKRSAEAAKKKLECSCISVDSLRDLVYWMLHPKASSRPTIEVVEDYLNRCYAYLKIEGES